MVVPLVELAAAAELAGFDYNFANRWQLLIPQWPWLILGLSAIPEALYQLAERAGHGRAGAAARDPGYRRLVRARRAEPRHHR